MKTKTKLDAEQILSFVQAEGLDPHEAVVELLLAAAALTPSRDTFLRCATSVAELIEHQIK